MQFLFEVIVAASLLIADGLQHGGDGGVEQEADEADGEDGDEHVVEAEAVPLVPDEVAHADAADEHFRSDDDEPCDADGDAHAGENGGGGGGKNDGGGKAQAAELKGAADVDPVLVHRSHSEGGVDKHRPDGADENDKQ